MNRTVTATNLEVKAVASSSLVISDALPVGTKITHGFSTAAASLIPAHHDETNGTTTNLVYNTNPEEVHAHTGLAAGSTALTFADAVNDGAHDKLYYVDYTVYIASAGDAITNQKLVAHLYRDAGIPDNTQRAITVDFYVADEATAGSDYTDKDDLGTYVNSLNLNALTKDASGEFRTGTIDIAIPSDTIPKNNNTSDYLRIVMRVYFDGALTGDRYEKTADSTVDGTKTYYAWDSTNGVFAAVASPVDGSLSTYYEKQDAGTLVYTDCASLTELAFNVRFESANK